MLFRDATADLIRDTLAQYGIPHPDERLVNSLRRIVIHVAAEEKGKVTRDMILYELEQLGLYAKEGA